MSLAQVAGTELTRQAVHLIETGKVRPSARSLQLIARRLGVPPHSLTVPVAGDSRERDWGAELARLCDYRRYDEVVALARGLLASDVPPAQQAVAHLHLGRALTFYQADSDEALQHLRRARRLFEADEDYWSAAEARDWEGAALLMFEDPKAAAVCEDALRRYRRLEPRRVEVEARMLEHLATCLSKAGDFARGGACYREALEMAGPVLSLARLARIYHGLGGCHASLGELPRAIDLVSRAAALYAVEQDLRPVPTRVELPRVENDLGMLLVQDRQHDRAEHLFRSALAHLEEAGADRMRSYVLLSLAELDQVRGDLDRALDVIGQAIDLATRLGERIAVATAHQQLGALRAVRGECDLAEASFDRAAAMFDELGLAERTADCQAARQRALAAPPAATRLERFAG